MRYVLLLLLFFTIVCGATVYMQVDKNGAVSYSDSPSPNAQVVDVPQASSIQTAIPQRRAASPGGKNAAPAQMLGPTEHKDYSGFSILAPVDQATFQNERDIPVEVNVVPSLQQNDSIQLYVDGVKYREPWNTPHMEIYQLDRGVHTISADLLDDHFKVLMHSNAITIFVHYQHV